MALAVLVLVTFVGTTLLIAATPRLVRRRIPTDDQQSLDETGRSLGRLFDPVVPIAAAVITGVVSVTAFALDGSAWPVWAAASVVSLVNAVVLRRSRGEVLRLLAEAGARPSGDAMAAHDRGRRRLSTAGVVCFTAGTCLNVLSRLDGLAWTVVPGVALVLVAFLLALVNGWRGARGPDPEPLLGRTSTD